jgi:hypothetical protein
MIALKTSVAIAILVVVIAGSFFIGQRVGYDNGYNVAYTSEHSHYLFEQKRANRMQQTVATQRRCVNVMAANIQPVDSTGFAGLGEMMQRFGLLYWGTVKCNQSAGFGYVTQQQYQRIVPSSGGS